VLLWNMKKKSDPFCIPKPRCFLYRSNPFMLLNIFRSITFAAFSRPPYESYHTVPVSCIPWRGFCRFWAESDFRTKTSFSQNSFVRKVPLCFVQRFFLNGNKSRCLSTRYFIASLHISIHFWLSILSSFYFLNDQIMMDAKPMTAPIPAMFYWP